MQYFQQKNRLEKEFYLIDWSIIARNSLKIIVFLIGTYNNSIPDGTALSLIILFFYPYLVPNGTGQFDLR
jgi:hypothetical protein